MATPVSKGELEHLQASFEQGRLQEAGALASSLLQRHRDPLSEHLIRGMTLLAEGRAREAYSFFLQASVIAPADARSYLGMAQSLFPLGHLQQAVAAGQQALRLDPTIWQAVLVIANAHAAMAQWPQAIAHYNGILAMGVTSASVHLGLGNALLRVRQLAEARAQFTRAIQIDPSRNAGYCNLGNALMAAGEYPEAIRLYRQSLALAPDEIAHTNLAHAYFAMGNFADAEAQSRRALALNPDFSEAHGILADALRKLDRDAEAVPHYQKHGIPESAGRALEVLYRLGDMDAFAAAQKDLSQSQPDNIRLATVSVQAAASHGAQYASRFCADPLKYIGVSNLTARLEPFEGFSEQILDEAKALDTVWEPPAKTTKGGFQTEGNLFALATPAITRLQDIIRESIMAYFAAHVGAADRYVMQRPKDLMLTGWVVRLRQAGRQDMHIHPDGWLSGVLYLRLPPRTATEGAIGFSLNGRNAAPLDFHHQPQAGDLVLFPSSLFHCTVPFSADSERISIAFDLLPSRS